MIERGRADHPPPPRPTERGLPRTPLLAPNRTKLARVDLKGPPSWSPWGPAKLDGRESWERDRERPLPGWVAAVSFDGGSERVARGCRPRQPRETGRAPDRQRGCVWISVGLGPMECRPGRGCEGSLAAGGEGIPRRRGGGSESGPGRFRQASASSLLGPPTPRQPGQVVAQRAGAQQGCRSGAGSDKGSNETCDTFRAA